MDDGEDDVVLLPNNVKPMFGDLTPEEAARRSAAARRAKTAERARQNELAKVVLDHKLATLPDQSRLAEIAGAVVMDMAVGILEGKHVVKDAAQGARIAAAFFDILRLENGQSTGDVVHRTREDLEARLAELRQTATNRVG